MSIRKALFVLGVCAVGMNSGLKAEIPPALPGAPGSGYAPIQVNPYGPQVLPPQNVGYTGPRLSPAPQLRPPQPIGGRIQTLPINRRPMPPIQRPGIPIQRPVPRPIPRPVPRPIAMQTHGVPQGQLVGRRTTYVGGFQGGFQGGYGPRPIAPGYGQVRRVSGYGYGYGGYQQGGGYGRGGYGGGGAYNAGGGGYGRRVPCALPCRRGGGGGVSVAFGFRGPRGGGFGFRASVGGGLFGRRC